MAFSGLVTLSILDIEAHAFYDITHMMQHCLQCFILNMLFGHILTLKLTILGMVLKSYLSKRDCVGFVFGLCLLCSS